MNKYFNVRISIIKFLKINKKEYFTIIFNVTSYYLNIN